MVCMNLLPTRCSEPAASGSNPVVVSLTVTETTVANSLEGNLSTNELPLEAALHRRADAMTEIMAKIMARPAAPRFWGLNE